MKKSQMEIVGLLLIVIVIIVVFFFMMNINIQEADGRIDMVREFEDTHITTNFPPILLDSSSNCTDSSGNYYQIRGLVNLCVNNPDYVCNPDNLAEDACTFLNKTVEYAINETMNEMWGYNYIFTITGYNREEFITNLTNGCISQINTITSTQIIPLRRGQNSLIQLTICF